MKVRQVYGLKHNADDAGGRSICRKTRKQGTLPKKRNIRVRYVGHGKLTWAIGRAVKEKQSRREEVRKRRAIGRKAEGQEPEARENKEQCLKRCQGPQGWAWEADVGPLVERQN